MKREISLEEISDGRLYTHRDLVRADCQDCQGCSACCHGMGSSIVLDPLDVASLTNGVGLDFAALLAEEYLELSAVDGVILPHLMMRGEEEACGFLTAKGRCSVHDVRPGICRLFPLGRYYQEEGFSYFLQTKECRRLHRGKVRVSKWLDVPDIRQYESYLWSWHQLLIQLQELFAREEQSYPAQALEKQGESCTRLLQLFFQLRWSKQADFYAQYARRESLFRRQTGLSMVPPPTTSSS